MPVLVQSQQSVSSGPSHKGLRGELYFQSFMVSQGILIASPVADLWRCDFIVEIEGKLVKVNVKTMSSRKNQKGYEVSVRTGGRGNNRRYTCEELDYFALVSLECERIWLIPVSDVSIGNIIWLPPWERERSAHSSGFSIDRYRIK